MKKMILISAVLAGVFVGCGDKKEANKDNFEEAINKHFDKRCAEISLVNGEFPMTIGNGDYNKASLDSLVKVGLATSSPTKTEDQSMIGIDIMTGKRKIIDGVEYKLTEEGKKALSPNTNKSGFSSNSNFCAGKYKVSSIENFTEPSEMMGSTYATVKFKKVAINVPAWADKLTKEEDYKRYAEKISKEPIEAEMTLILTNDGWVSEKDMR